MHATLAFLPLVKTGTSEIAVPLLQGALLLYYGTAME